MGFAVNASTIGMAIGGLAVALFGRRIDRRRGILLSLALLSIPTALLATMPDLPIFTLLRIVQGLCMSTAFALTLAYLGEHTSAGRHRQRLRRLHHRQRRLQPVRPPGGRGAWSIISGLAANFCVFAALNLAGAVLVWFTRRAHAADAADGRRRMRSPFASWLGHLANPRCAPAFAIGFLSCSPSSAPSPT